MSFRIIIKIKHYVAINFLRIAFYFFIVTGIKRNRFKKMPQNAGDHLFELQFTAELHHGNKNNPRR